MEEFNFEWASGLLKKFGRTIKSYIESNENENNT